MLWAEIIKILAGHFEEEGWCVLGRMAIAETLMAQALLLAIFHTDPLETRVKGLRGFLLFACSFFCSGFWLL